MDKCGKCGEDIEGEAVRTTGSAGSAFHAACFTCEVCNKNLHDSSFSTDPQNKLYCPEVATELEISLNITDFLPAD